MAGDAFRCRSFGKKFNFVNTRVDFVRRRSAAAGLNFVVLDHALNL